MKARTRENNILTQSTDLFANPGSPSLAPQFQLFCLLYPPTDLWTRAIVSHGKDYRGGRPKIIIFWLRAKWTLG